MCVGIERTLHGVLQRHVPVLDVATVQPLSLATAQQPQQQQQLCMRRHCLLIDRFVPPQTGVRARLLAARVTWLRWRASTDAGMRQCGSPWFSVVLIILGTLAF